MLLYSFLKYNPYKVANRLAQTHKIRRILLPAHTILLLLICLSSHGHASAKNGNWKKEAGRVTIIRDNWGIAHVYGKTDADAVFGMIYAQAEDDFPRVEANYITSLGRSAEIEGESKIYQDLRMKLFIQPESLKAQYAASSSWLKLLMNAWADGLNYYLAQHTEVKPKVIQHFEPWMALSFTEGSIGADIERLTDLDKFQAFYSKPASVPISSAAAHNSHTYDRHPFLPPETTGSNGIAIAPKNTAAHHALLLINPHVTFFFRSELQMVSEEGLDAYGAATWGQFFIYQGFNDRAGWMHTSSWVDASDEYLETVVKKGNRFFYKYGSEERPVTTAEITIPFKTATGKSEKKFTVYRTHHGPIVREADGKWLSIRLMNKPVEALTQSYTRTKARDYKSYRQTMELKANSSNNTIFADADGDIAYFHGNFIPKRDTSFNWNEPVDGSNPATEWQGLLSIDETPHLLNPDTGWLFNVNNSPWSAAGASSPKQADYPAYVDNGIESARGRHAIRLLQNQHEFTLNSLITSAYDSYLPWFEKLLPMLEKAWDESGATNPLKAKLADQIALLRTWDCRWAATSIPTTLAVYWGEALGHQFSEASHRAHIPQEDYIAAHASGDQLLQALAEASGTLTADFGTWKKPWGDINRYQRLNGDLVPPFDDAKPSTAVPFTSSEWGSLAAFGTVQPGTKKRYGVHGNSFVAAIEFSDKVRARAISVGGESGHLGSPHFNDQISRYPTGDLRTVYFYRSDLEGHIERQYHPGE